ncbi:alkaline phosphatase family protein [Microcella sp.]|uniref:alkaline phosphatase family protein n=1 Tax=Microcella sp. TaxID=1913979 RepID=UPI003919B96F
MLPAPPGSTRTLGDVLSSALSAIRGEVNPLALPATRSAAVVLVDGLGAHPLAAHRGHARRLTAAIPKRGGTIHSAFPTTTAAALATLTTGRPAGEHGLVGYSAHDADGDRVLNLLTGWDSSAHPEAWQRHETLFERAATQGIEPIVVAARRYADSGFTRAVLRGARFVAAESIADRMARTRELLAGSEPRLIYTYVPELDKAGHATGTASARWLHRLEELDAALAQPLAPAGTGALLTADHGMLDIAPHARRVIGADDELWRGVRHVAGEPRCLHLVADDPAEVAGILARWTAREGARSWVVTRDEAIDAGWFGGPVEPAIASRIGDVIVAARAAVVYYDERTATDRSLAMVGQHGSFSDAETRIPLARFGAFGAA